MKERDIDLCDYEQCSFSGVCARFLPKDRIPKGEHRWYITDCTNYIHFIPK